ncbi:MAG: GGDEF domain-containing protein [Candidatus Acidiferrales bacterium]|jgi:diguanylate cyclase (GGDEF)-like protein
MLQPGEASRPQSSAEDSFLDLLVETLQGLEDSVRGQFLRQFFRTTAQIDLSEAKSNEYWEQILQRRRELNESLGKRVSLKTAMVDVLSSMNFLRVPILMEYDEFKKLQINAATDALTGLYNRRLFDEYCEKELNRAKRYSHSLAIVILDLHKLKDVNDRHGHLQGDQVIQLAASTLRKTLRASDFAFRIGGDEFCLLLPQTDPEQAVTLCRRVRAQYELEVQPLKVGVGVTLDFGVAVYPEDGEQKGELMGLADKRLYELKHAGGSSPRVIQLETQSQRETPAAPLPTPAPAPSPRASASGPAASAAPRPQVHTDQRKWERVSLTGTKAHAVLSDFGQKTAKVIDLSYGGVALLLEKSEEIPNQFNAVLHVPILPPVRVILRKAYSQRLDDGRVRLGCSFVS